MKLSLIFSIFNRSELFARGLATIAKQTMDPRDFEIVIVDDNSTEDISQVYKPYLGKLNIRHIKYDHTKSPIFKEMNPDGIEKDWYHTQAISANIGIKQATGEVLCISQPEMLHSPQSLALGYSGALQHKAVFGEIIMVDKRFNDWLKANDWQVLDYDALLETSLNFGQEYTYSHFPEQGFYEMYWHIMYLPRDVALQIGGVDLNYQRGVYAEDDQFKMRVRMFNCPDTWGGRPKLRGTTKGYIVGIHQSHIFDEGQKIKRQDRQSLHWEKGANRNRELFRHFNTAPYTIANEDYPDTWGDDLIISNDYYERTK